MSACSFSSSLSLSSNSPPPPEDFEGFKYLYTPEDGYSLNPEFIISYEEDEASVDEDGVNTNEPVKKVIKYQSGKIITIHPSGEVEET